MSNRRHHRGRPGRKKLTARPCRRCGTVSLGRPGAKRHECKPGQGCRGVTPPALLVIPGPPDGGDVLEAPLAADGIGAMLARSSGGYAIITDVTA